MNSTNTLSANWNYPTDIRVGAGRLAEVGTCCDELDSRAPLLVVDAGLTGFPAYQSLLDNCRTAGLRCTTFSEFAGNPSGDNIAAGVTAYREGNCDSIIAFGGGSALDVGKAIALMAGQRGEIWDYEDCDDNWKRANAAAIAPVIAIPTTAGTGSEVGRASVITDPRDKVKKVIFHPAMLPRRVILDPQVTLGLPPHLTAATGMDALSHSLEAWCSSGYHPMAEGIALEGIRLVKENLPIAFTDGNNLQARTQMLVASSMGATAFQKGLGAMHALAHPLGARYNAHHGLLNAILMPYVVQANQDAISDKLTQLHRYLCLAEAGHADLLSWLLALREQLAIPHTLQAIGIEADEAELIGKLAVADPSAGGNPIAFDATEYQQIFRNAVQGKLQP